MEYEEGFLSSFVICKSIRVYSKTYFFWEGNVESPNDFSAVNRDFQWPK